MTRILHLSDLHFGTVDDRLVAPLIDLAHLLQPDLCVVSGDLTQRARADQFQQARSFVDRLPGPVLVVPGNHDVPLYNLSARLVVPFTGYRRNFAPDLEPKVSLHDAIVQGVNTTNPLAWKSGYLRPASVARMTKVFQTAAPGLWRVAVMHHAPVPAADGTPADIAYPAQALAALARAGTDIVLSGHTHMPHAGYGETAAGVLFLQVGTAISTRLKTETNDFALIELAPGSVTRHTWLAHRGEGYRAAPATRFVRTGSGWRPVTEG